MNISDRELHDLLKNHSLAEKQAIIRRLKGKIVKNVFCVCGDNPVAEIDDAGKIRETDDRLLAYKTRIDGFYGFQCVCGNDSRQCVQEVGLDSFGTPTPTSEDIEEALKRVKIAPSSYPIIEGSQSIDGFRIVEVS